MVKCGSKLKSDSPKAKRKRISKNYSKAHKILIATFIVDNQHLSLATVSRKLNISYGTIIQIVSEWLIVKKTFVLAGSMTPTDRTKMEEKQLTFGFPLRPKTSKD